MEERVGLQGKFICEIYDKDGNLKESFEVPNVVTKEGKFYLLRAGVANQAVPITTWYVGLIGADVVPSENDTALNQLGQNGTYQEITAYTSQNRPTYTAELDNTTRSIHNNSSPASFEATQQFTTYGAFITSTAGKNTNNGILLAAGRFGTPKTLAASEILVVKYTITS